MIDKFLYLISEGFRSLWRAKLAGFATVTAIGISTSFIGFGAFIGQDISDLLQLARSQYRLEVFFSPLITDSEANQSVQKIAQIPGVRKSTLVTKQEAAEIFEEEFGENIFELLDENPLPSSCIVKLTTNGNEPLDVRPIIRKIEKIEHVDEVRHQGKLVSTIEKYYQGFFIIMTGVAIVVLFGTVILISNTIRLSIYARRDLIDILKLVGATNQFIRFPFVIEGIVEGVFGAILASAFIYGFVRATNYFLNLFTHYNIHWDFQIVAIMICVIMTFSALGSHRAVRRFLT